MSEVIEKKVIEIVADVLNVEDINLKSSQEKLDEWDSMAYLSVISRLEEEFNIEINQENINNFTSIKKIIEEVKYAKS